VCLAHAIPCPKERLAKTHTTHDIAHALPPPSNLQSSKLSPQSSSFPTLAASFPLSARLPSCLVQ
jgi:hypothetical protein